MNVYRIGGNKFAMGTRGGTAIAVVQRILNPWHPLGGGRPSYKGVRGRRPYIGQDAKRIKARDVSAILRNALLAQVN